MKTFKKLLDITSLVSQLVDQEMIRPVGDILWLGFSVLSSSQCFDTWLGVSRSPVPIIPKDSL